MEKHEILKVYVDREETVDDPITQEIPLTLYVNNEELVTLLSSPTDLRELSVGFLLASGIIADFDKIENISIDRQNWSVYVELRDRKIDFQTAFKRMYTSGCGRGTLFYSAADIMHRNKKRLDLKVERKAIFAMMKDFQIRSDEFNQTGGVHSAALADTEKILIIREDIGRHNAIDKILGYGLINGIELGDKIVLSSGRVSSEILLKAQKTQIPVIVSRSAPTDQAIKHAKSADITLIGFARGGRMNIYNRPERIL
ncbi:formate dehydrogenase accessory sulfurtransferase FdhD [Candidatus Omnitrophota bacterium]